MVRRKRMVAGLLCCIFACSQPAVHITHAAGKPQVNQENVKKGQSENSDEIVEKPEDLAPDYNDPDYVKHQLLQEEPASFSLKSASARTSKSPFTGLTYTHAQQFDDNNIVHGIDVSQWQATIDWAKVKKAGVKFVFIRCGYTGLAQKFAMYEDNYFRQNVENAYNAGIQVGIYYFSNAKTTAEVKKEAAKTLELLSGYQDKITLPVVYDFEAFSNAYRAYGTSKAQATSNALTFMKAMEAAGYDAMNYSSPSFVASSYDVSRLSDYDMWLANYTTRTSYTGDYSYWQYSSTGHVDGISGNVDCNFYYSQDEEDEENEIPVDSEEPRVEETVTGIKMKSNTSNSITIKWTPLEEAAGYDVYRCSSYGGTYKKIQTIDDAAISSYKDSSVAKTNGRQYYYKIIPFFIGTEVDELEDPSLENVSSGENLENGDSQVDDTGNENSQGNQTDSGNGEGQEDSDSRGKTEVVIYGQESDTLTANTTCKYERSLRTNAAMNLRIQAGTEYASSTVVPLGTILSYKKYTLSTTGSIWYLVNYKVNGMTYKGYLAGGYVTTYTAGRAKRNTHVRTGAGFGAKAIKYLPKEKKVRVQKTVNDSNGDSWSYVRVTLGGKIYEGYVKTSYIRQI